MPERLLFMQTEDGMVSFERDDGSTIIHPLSSVPENFTEGDIIISIVHSEDNIEFIELDTIEMEKRRARIAARAARIRARARRGTDTEEAHSCTAENAVPSEESSSNPEN